MATVDPAQAAPRRRARESGPARRRRATSPVAAASFAATGLSDAPLLGVTLVFSVFVNALILTGPIFMLQVYDRVLSSRSEETLLALILLVGFLYAMMGLLDFSRGRVMARFGARLAAALEPRLFDAELQRAARSSEGPEQGGLNDLGTLRTFLASPGLMALFDLPWTLVFLAAIFLFHPWLGWLALAGGLGLIAFALLNKAVTFGPLTTAQTMGRAADRWIRALVADAETVLALGMRTAGHGRWQAMQEDTVVHGTRASDRAGAFSALTRSGRLFLQSAMLGLGALLVLRGELTAGAMIAASILLGRALMPVEQLVAHWPALHAALVARRAIARTLAQPPPPRPRTDLPRPEARLDVRDLTVVPPGEALAALRLVRIALRPGQAMGVIGPSGAGKSTLARALCGLWAPATGSIRLDGATLGQYPPDQLGRHIGYLPQQVRLLEGTIAENIARFDAGARPEAVIAAARAADAHALILRLPQGYDTPVDGAHQRLSGGQVQRLGLARALYGDPVLLLLDEPNANLDNAGSAALNAAIQAHKARGGAVLIMAHRPAALEHCDQLMVLEAGVVRAAGPRDEVLAATVLNRDALKDPGHPGGIS